MTNQFLLSNNAKLGVLYLPLSDLLLTAQSAISHALKPASAEVNLIEELKMQEQPNTYSHVLLVFFFIAEIKRGLANVFYF